MESGDNDVPLNESVKVIIRCRPLSDKEEKDNHKIIIDVDARRGVVHIFNPKEESVGFKKAFILDAAYDWDSTQQMVYDESIRPLVASVLMGFNGCVFAYGQTGTGKTYTMEGEHSLPEREGIIPKSFQQIWNYINRTTNTNFLVSASYLEIYMEELRDLLKRNSARSLEIREREGWGTYVPGLHSEICRSAEDMIRVMKKGNKNRTVGRTNMNAHSSRSHAAFLITIEMCNTITNTVKVGKLNMIDLAGSERQNKTGSTTVRLREASKINKSLSALGNVISALAENSQHIPYRDSKLTRLLQDSLGGNSKTIMIATVGPASYNYEETLTTLRYAHRAKNIKNLPILNEDPKDAKLREYQDEIARLKTLIAERKMKEAVEEMKRSIKRRQKLETAKEEIEDSVMQSEKSTTNLDEDLEMRKKQLELERLKTEEMANVLANLESQLIRGGKNILDSLNENQIQIDDRLAEIAARKKIEIEMQQRLIAEEETTFGMQRTFSSLTQEVQSKTKILKEFMHKLEICKTEIKDITEEHSRDRRELENTQDVLLKELKLKLKIIEHFIPLEERDRLYSSVVYQEEFDEWVRDPKLLPMPRRPTSKPGLRRPVSDMSLLKALYPGPKEMRYKSENIANLELDQHERTTFVYEAPSVCPMLKSALEDALQPEADLDITIPTSGRTTRARSAMNKMEYNTPKIPRPHTTKPEVMKRKGEFHEKYPNTKDWLPEE